MKLPDNWQQMSHNEQNNWFHMYALDYIADGEIKGIKEDIPEEIKIAYEDFVKQN